MCSVVTESWKSGYRAGLIILKNNAKYVFILHLDTSQTFRRVRREIDGGVGLHTEDHKYWRSKNFAVNLTLNSANFWYFKIRVRFPTQIETRCHYHCAFAPLSCSNPNVRNTHHPEPMKEADVNALAAHACSQGTRILPSIIPQPRVPWDYILGGLYLAPGRWVHE